MSLLNMSSGVSIMPKHFFGVNQEINLHLQSDQQIIYVAGHNVIRYQIEEKNQYFLPGTEGTEAITHVALSNCGRYISVCERNVKDEKGLVTIFEVISSKKRQKLPDAIDQMNKYKSQEFVCSAFSVRKEEILVTLTGSPDWQILLWDWDKCRLLSTCSTGIPAQIHSDGGRFQISWNPCDVEGGKFLLTGPNNTFKYLKKDQDHVITTAHTQINNIEQGRKISNTFTCHAWSQETGDILVCTDNGEMIMCDNDGQYRAFILDSPMGESIQQVTALEKGFLIAQKNSFWIYRSSRVDDRAPLKRHGDKCIFNIRDEPAHIGSSNSIKSFAINQKENQIYIITNFGQMITGYLDCATSRLPPFEATFDYIQGQFHKQEITGLDVCIRKQLIVTCSKDKTVNIWDYATRTLEIQTTFAEECHAVAFHPSGLHLVVAMQDKILMCNILSRTITSFKTLAIKGCTEIKFAHGGHLFACAANQKDIHVFNFYTAECPISMQFTGHVSRVRCIDWFENDLGFTTCGNDGNVYFYDLFKPGQLKDPGKRNTDKDFNKKDVKFTSVCNVPGKDYEIFAVGNDKLISSNSSNKKGSSTQGELSVTISQILITPSGKNIIAGVGEPERPGAIQVWSRPEEKPIDKVNEIQAHSKPVDRLRLSADCQNLFSIGQDGILAIFECRDRDKSKRVEAALQPSFEILTEQTEMEKYKSEKETLKQDYVSLTDSNDHNVEKGIELKRQLDKIEHLTKDLESNKQSAENKYGSLKDNKVEAINNNENKRRELLDHQQEIIEQRRNEYSQKMLEDSARFNQLQVQKEEERRTYSNAVDKLKQDHLARIQAEQEAHRKEIEVKNTQIDQMRREIKQIEEENQEILEQIRQDTEFEVTDITRKNDQNKTTVNDLSLKSKAELQLTNNKLQDISADIEQLNRQIQDKDTQNKTQDKQCNELKMIIANQLKEIHLKDEQIAQREKKIYSLKKKTQELEKFKFVLDYKIKELKRDITPQQNEILALKQETNELDAKLKHYNQVSAGLGFTVDDNRTRQDQMQKLIKSSRATIRRNEIYIRSYKNAVYWVAQHIDDYEQLKFSINENLYQYVTDMQMKDVEVDSEIKKEFQAQEMYLINSKLKLKNDLKKKSMLHKEDNLNIMNENISLIQDIQDLRGRVRDANQYFNKIGGPKILAIVLASQAKKNQMLENAHEVPTDPDQPLKSQNSTASKDRQDELEPLDGYDNSVAKNIAVKRKYIQSLRDQLQQLRIDNQKLGGSNLTYSQDNFQNEDDI